MIDKLSYDEIMAISKNLKEQAEIISKLIENRNIQELSDFAATVEGYSKFLENTIEINKDADKALEELKSQLH
jgi:hypothetical protein